MTSLRIYILLLTAVCTAVQIAAAEHTEVDSLLAELDKVLEEREIYVQRKTERLDSLKNLLGAARNDDERFEMLGRLYTEYHSFNADSAYMLSLRQLEIAQRTGNRNQRLNALLNRANILSSTGMYHETLQLLDSLDREGLPHYLRPYLYHTKRTLYGYLAAYAAFSPERAHYEEMTDLYRDSLLVANPPGSLFHVLIKADRLNVHNRPQEAVDMLQNYIAANDLSEHDKAICAWTLSESYGLLGDTENRKKQLLISSIADMKSAVREYLSLRQLALLLYDEGDLDRAYHFLTIAVEDAAKCNARQRIVELNDIYPMVNGIYVNMVRNQKKNLELRLSIITVLSVLLVLALLFMRKQMQRVAAGRRAVEEANTRLHDSNRLLSESNERLNETNACLQQSNAKLQQAYSEIAEISELKEVYICRYMDQSIGYIEMLDGFRRHVGKLLNSGKIDELRRLAKSTALVDEELKAFYDRFDETFLGLFPDFVDDFNNLLLPGEAILPRKAGALNTELRIFALIRLGITDSDKIAKFLRYSLSTIYNYRTKVRNKARGDRNLLEQQVARLGKR